MPRRHLFAALFLIAFSLILSFLFWPYGPPPRINVRWGDSVTVAQRETLERRYELARPVHQGTDLADRSPAGRTWSYQLLDTSTDNIRRLVQDPSAEDTAAIDRSQYVAVTGGERPRSPFLQLLGAGVAALIVAGFSMWFGLNERSGFGAVVIRGIPEIPAEVLGFFRVFYATFLFVLLSRERLVINATFVQDLEEHRPFAWAWVDMFLGRPELVARLESGILVLLVLFAVGLWTRLTYVLVAAGFTVWLAITLGTNGHTWGILYMTILCLVPMPWGEAFSVDEMLRRRRGQRANVGLRGRHYGFALWVPGFVLGAVWLGAAYTKLETSGPAWILGGAVRYHWVVDSIYAPVSWGLWVASHEWVAVFLSFAGVVLETAFIATAFTASSRARSALAFAIGLPLLAGFYLFQGVLWWPWWVMLLSFAIPWHALYDAVVLRNSSPPAKGQQPNELRAADPGSRSPSGLKPVHGVVVCLVCLPMIAKLPLGFGRFDAYSSTYASPADFDAQNPVKWVDRVWIGYGLPGAREIPPGGATSLVADAIMRLGRQQPLPARYGAEIRAFGETLVLANGGGQVEVTLVRERARFEWTRGRFTTGDRNVIGTLDSNSLRFVPGVDTSR